MGVLAAVPAITDLLTGTRLLASLVGILVIAFLASRLLGARRSPGAIVVSGLIGWLAGATLAVVLARSHEHGESGFTRNLWLFATFFTMSATVLIEMLAKPGSLARAQSYLTSFPRPIRSMRRRSRRISRYVEITRIAARHGLGRSLGIDESVDGEASKAPVGVRLRARARRGRGHVRQARPGALDTVGPPAAGHRRRAVAPPGQRSPRPTRRGRAAWWRPSSAAPSSEVFAEFDWEPCAAASIGQAYRARLVTGEAVIVKAQRPGIRDAVERDLDVLDRAGQHGRGRASPGPRSTTSKASIEEFSTRLREELDFRVESPQRHRDRRAATSPASGVTIPHVHRELSTQSVLVVEWLDGVSVRRSDEVDAIGADRPAARPQPPCATSSSRCWSKAASTPIRTRATCSCCGTAASGSSTSAPSAASTRWSKPRSARCSSPSTSRLPISCATPSSKSPPSGTGSTTTSSNARLARFMSRHLGPGSAPSAAMFNDLLHVLFDFGIALPAEFSTFFRAWSRWKARSPRCSPASA